MPQLNSGSVIGVLSLVLAIFAVIFGPSGESLLLVLADFGIDLSSLSSGPVVYDTARDVRYLGSANAGVEHYQNIFYAEDTTGKNRFAPPVKLTPTPGSIIDATEAGAWCPQATGDVLPFTSRVTNISENCLSLRVARMWGTKPEAKLPIVVYLHGGGHALGSASERLYEPDDLVTQAAADGKPVVWVAINYRLNFFGFATSKALIETKHTNVGLRDQRAALEWVRDNIAAFGGDPNQVTVIGQSVGASDIGLQLVAFGGQQEAPFAKAIMMSGGPGLNFNTKADLVKNNTASVAELAGCVKDGDAQSAATLACLREAPFEKLTDLAVAAMRVARPPFGEGFFYPTYDGDFLPDRPSTLLRAGKVTKGVPLIGSWTTNDGAWYAGPLTATDEEVLASFGLWLFDLSESTKARLLELYPVSDFEHMVRPDIDGPISPQYYRAAQMNKDLWFTCPVLDFTWNYAKAGCVDASDIRIYEHNATRFAPAFNNMGVPMWRVAHLSDIPYVLNNQRIGDSSPEQLELSKLVSRKIIDFVVPDSTGTNDWPPAFGELTKLELASEYPPKLNVNLFGGPLGSGPVPLARVQEEGQSPAQEALQSEKLFKRCEFINSARVREEIGV